MYILKGSNSFRDKILRLLSLLLVICIIASSVQLPGRRLAFADGAATSSNASEPDSLDTEEELQDGLIINDEEEGLDDELEETEVSLYADRAAELSNELMQEEDIVSEEEITLASLSDATQTNGVSFKYVKRADHVIIAGLADSETATEITLPNEIDSLPVKAIAQNAFYFKSLTAVNFEENSNIEKIGRFAFAGNILTEVELPDNLTEVHKGAFRDNSITSLNLKNVEKLGALAFASNQINTLNLGNVITTIDNEAFRENSLSAVDFPDSLVAVGENILSFNTRYVAARSDKNPLTVPAIQKVEGGHGYVINPITIKVSYIDEETGTKLLDDALLGDDLTSDGNVFAKGSEQTYTPPVIEGYEPIFADGQDAVVFTPDEENYQLTVKYRKRNAGLSLTKDPNKSTMIAPNTPNIEEVLRSLVKATNAAGEDLSAQVEINPASIDTSVEGKTYDINYTLRGENGEVERLSISVYIGTDLNNFPLGNDWVLGDFVYSGREVRGFSAQGLAKVATNKDLILPHINPATGEAITVVVHGNNNNVINGVYGANFANRGLTSVRDFNGNIKELRSDVFRDNTTLKEAVFPNLENIGSYSLYRTALEEFDFSKIKNIYAGAFERTKLKKVEAPNVEVLAHSAFRDIPTLGSDPDYPQGIYFPKLTALQGYTFVGSGLTYVDETQIPNVTTMPNSSDFSGNSISRVDLPKVTTVGSYAFSGQRGKALTELNMPALETAAYYSFQGNGLTEVNLPSLKKTGGYAFSSNNISTINLPSLEELGSYAFNDNKIEVVQGLPMLKKIGDRSFINNKIKEAYLPSAQKIEQYAFWHENNANRNPGLAAYGGLIPIYTDNTALESKENYIINPTETDTGEFVESDFTWDASKPGTVTGFTPKGKAKLAARDYNLVLPETATKVANYAFNASKIKTLVGKNVTELGGWSFEANPLTSIDLPELRVAGTRAFLNNSGGKIKDINLDKLTTVEEAAFQNAGLEGTLNLPLVTELSSGAFYNNAISKIYAPVLKVVGRTALANNNLTEITGESFPVLEEIKDYGFSSQYPAIKKIDLPTLKKMQGYQTFLNNVERGKTIENIVLPHGMKVTSYKLNDTFNAYQPYTKDIYLYAYYRPGAILLTNPPNADGTLDRSNPDNWKEEINYTHGWPYRNWKDKSTGYQYRKYIINPSTVKVNYRLDTGESLDGADGRPLQKDYREYIYEELDPELREHIPNPDSKEGKYILNLNSQGRAYKAPAIPGYVLLKTIKADGTDTRDKTIMVPYQKEGERTDREITFVYKKLESADISNVKLSYFAADARGTSEGQEKEYIQRGETNLLPQMLTAFNIEEVKKLIKKGKIRVDFDTNYIDLESITMSISDETKQFVPEDGLSVYPGGLEIKLKENITPGSAIRGIKIQYRYKAPNTPEGASTNFKMILLDEDDSGSETLIGAAENVNLSLTYQPKPTITAKMQLNIPGYNYSGYTDASGGPRDLGNLEQVGEDSYKVVEDPAAATFYYTVDNVFYNMDGVRLKSKIPTYTAIENGVEVTKTAVFDQALNPNWTLEADGVTLTSTVRFDPSRDENYINRQLPKLKFKFPNLKEKSNVVNEIYANLMPTRDPKDTSTATVGALGDLGEGDSLTVYPLYVVPKPWVPGDTSVGKHHTYAPRSLNRTAYLYDSAEDKQKEIPFNLGISSTNEISDLKNVSIIDYDLDSRLYYTGIRFNNRPNEVDNMTVTVLGYKKNGTKLNPAADDVVFEREVAVDSTNPLNFGAVTDIDYIQIKLNSTETVPLSKRINFTVVTKVKNPDERLFDNTVGGPGNVLVNKALFLGDRFKKGTDTPDSIKPNNESYEFLNSNMIIPDKDSVSVLEYKAYLGVEKSLIHSKNPDSYKKFPSAESGEYVLEGQKGAWHISLDSYIEGNRNARANEIIENLEIIDVLPEAVAVERSDVKLDPLFIRTGGKFTFIEDYPVTENGVTEQRTAIKFTAQRFNIKSYGNEKLRIASINSKYTARTVKTMLTNKVYARWDNENVIVSNPATNSAKTDYLGPDGSTVPENKKWSYGDASIKNAVLSALTARLEIRNRQDMIWQEKTPTGSGEPFDYRMTIRNLTQSEGDTDYTGLDVINVFPTVDDLVLSGTNQPRNSEFTNVLDLSRMGDLVVPEGYVVQYLNSDTQVHDMLASGKTMDDIGNDPSLWSTTPQANAKAIRITAQPGKKLPKGDVVRFDIPMKAPTLSGITDSMVGKKAIDTFVLRYHEPGTANYRKYQEPNPVYNYMTVPKGSIKFTKYGKSGLQSSNDSATPLEGALFEIYDYLDMGTAIASAASNVNGEVVFDELPIDKNYLIKEVVAPNAYTISTNNVSVYKTRFAAAAANNYELVLTEAESKTLMNIKPLKANLKINKYIRDGVTPLGNIGFKIKGLDSTNNTIDTTEYTDANGQILLTDLPEGNYEVSEIESTAINRYQAAPKQRFRVDASNTGTEISLRFINDKFQVLFQKVIVSNEEDLDPANWNNLTDFGKRKVPGYKFKVSGDDGTSFTTRDTDGNGKVILQNLKTGVVYTVTEQEAQSSNLKNLYTHNEREYKFKITDDGKLLNALNDTKFKQYALNFPNITKNIKGVIKVEKVDNKTPENPLAGAEFKISKLTFNSAGAVASVTDLNRNIISAIDADNKATATFDNLDPGTYRIEEAKAPAGYVLSKTQLEVNIPKDVTDTMLRDSAYNVNGNEIIYTVSRKMTNTPISVEGIKGSEIEGYKNVSHAVANKYVADNIANNPKLKVRKTGNSSSTVYEALAGVVFNLYVKENGVLAQNPELVGAGTDIISDANGVINFGNYAFDYGKTYVIKEKEGIVGYEKYEGEFAFTPKDYAAKPGFNGRISFFINNNKEAGKISISKYDSYTKENLAGAKFALYKATKAELAANPSLRPLKELVTNESGYAVFDKLLYGTYVIRELETPDGNTYRYRGLAEDIEVEVSARKKIINKSVLNTRVVDIPVTKTWDGGSEASVRVGLYRSTSVNELGTLVEEKTLSHNADANLNFKAKFEDKPLTDERGVVYYYSVREIGLDPSLYTSVVTGTALSGFTITNTATSSNKTSIGVTKNWDLGIASLPEGSSVKVTLYRVNSGDRLTSTDITKIDETVLNANNNWQHTFTGLQKRNLGYDIVYRVDEEPTEGFDSRRTVAAGNENSFIITNTGVRRRTIEIAKNWQGIDPANAPEVRVELVNAFTGEVMANATLAETNGNYGTTFNDIPSYYYTLENGKIKANPIKYKLVEKYVEADGSLSNSRPGYTTISGFNDSYFNTYGAQGNIRNGLIVPLTNHIEELDIKVKKTWSGVDASAAPDVKIQLYDTTADTSADKSNTGTHIAIGPEITLNQAGSWAHIYNDLPKYKPDGATVIDYRIKELTNFDGYTSSIIKTVKPKTETEREEVSFALLNERVTTSVSLSKTWNIKAALYDAYSLEKPEVTLHLFADETNDNIRNGNEIFPKVGGTAVNAIKLNTANNFSVRYENLPKYAADGVTEITYYAREDALPGFTSANQEITLSRINGSDILSAGFENTQDSKSIKVTKLWDGLDKYTEEEKAALPRVELALYATIDGSRQRVTGRNAELRKVNENDAAVWEASFDNLPTHTLSGSEISYSVEEVGTETRPGYEVSYEVRNNGLETVITNKVITTKLTLKKHWQKTENSLVPTNEAKFYLQKNGVRTTENPIVITEASRYHNNTPWTYVFDNLPVYEIGGSRTILYSIEEVPVPGFTIRALDDVVHSDANGRAVQIDKEYVNTYETVDVNVEKTWIGVNSAQAPDIELKLVDITADKTENHTNTAVWRDVETFTLSNRDNWAKRFDNLPKYKDDGITEIVYDVVEVSNLPGYTLSKTKDILRVQGDDDDDINFNLINSRVKRDIRITKKWNVSDNIFGKGEGSEKFGQLPEINIHVYADATNNNVDDRVEITNTLLPAGIKLNADNKYTIAFGELNKYAEDGVTEIVYSASEDAVAGFETDASDKVLTLDCGTECDTLVAEFVNNQMLDSIRVIKLWEGLDRYSNSELANLPDIELELYAIIEGEIRKVTGRKAVLERQDPNDPSLLVASFENLPKYTFDFKPISYNVVEKDADKRPGYNATYEVENGLDTTIKNTLKTRDIYVTKTWVDEDKALIDTSKVDVYLKKNGVRTTSTPVSIRATDTAYNGQPFSYVFSNLPYYEADGKTPINYSVEEVELPGFKTVVAARDEAVTGNPTKLDTKIFDITNTYATVDIEVEKHWEGVEPNLTPYATFALAKLEQDKSTTVIAGTEIVLNLANAYKASYENMPKYEADGKTEINYIITELDKKPGYEFNYEKKVSDGGNKIELVATNKRVEQKLVLTKTFKDDISGYERPEVTFRLYMDETADGIENPVEISEADGIKLNKGNGFRKELKLPKYAADGTSLIAYYVSEDALAGYKPVAGRILLASTSDASKGYNLGANIENELIVRDIKVEKLWTGLDEYYKGLKTSLPEVHAVLVDVTDANKVIKLDTKALNISNAYKAEFKGYPKFKKDGTTEIVYKVYELEAEDKNFVGYKASSSDAIYENDGTIGFVVENSPLYRDIEVSKKWKGMSPGDKIEVYLLRDGERTTAEPVVITGADNWYHKFENEPYYRVNGREKIEYSIEELPIQGIEYSLESRQDGDNLIIEITNESASKTVTDGRGGGSVVPGNKPKSDTGGPGKTIEEAKELIETIKEEVSEAKNINEALAKIVKVAKTGDYTNVFMYVVLFAASISLIIFLLVKKRRKDKK